MHSYNETQSRIKFLQEERDNKKYSMYDQKPLKTVYQKIKDEYKIKNLISNLICRNELCKKQLNQKFRFIATAYHSNGKLRHYFYFCSIQCFNQFRAFCGLKVPILQGQTILG